MRTYATIMESNDSMAKLLKHGKRDVYVIKGILFPPANEHSQPVEQHDELMDELCKTCTAEERKNILHTCKEFNAHELDQEFADRLAGTPVLDNHQPDKVVGVVHSAKIDVTKLVTVTLLLYADIDDGKNVINLVRAGTYGGLSAFHRFQVYRLADGSFNCIKSRVLEVSVCAKGMRTGTYVTNYAKRVMPAKEAIETLHQQGAVFASSTVSTETVDAEYNKLISINSASAVLETGMMSSGELTEANIDTTRSGDNIDSMSNLCEGAPATHDDGGVQEKHPMQVDDAVEVHNPIVEKQDIQSMAPEQKDEQQIATEGDRASDAETAKLLADATDAIGQVNEQNATLQTQNEELARQLKELQDAQNRQHAETEQKEQQRIQAEREKEQLRVQTQRDNISNICGAMGASRDIFAKLPLENIDGVAEFLEKVQTDKEVAQANYNKRVSETTKLVTAVNNMKGMIGTGAPFAKATRQVTLESGMNEQKREADIALDGQCTASQNASKRRCTPAQSSIDPPLCPLQALKAKHAAGDIGWSECWHEMEEIVYRSQMPDESQTISGTVAASATGAHEGTTSEGYNADLDILAQVSAGEHPCALPRNCVSLCGPSLRHLNEPFYNMMQKNVQDLAKIPTNYAMMESNFKALENSKWSAGF